MGAETLLQHVEFAYVNYISIITFCAVGILFNAIMLIYLIKKKQVFASVYSIYMIQIVTTDILICVVWLTYLTLLLNELPSKYEVQQTIHPPELQNSYLLSQLEESFRDVTRTFEADRILFAVYNMHYYINIFLLAMMSIERCLAVKKSLQCQRYHFKKNIIAVVSVGMWLTAIACALPSYINPDWITESGQTDLLLGIMSEDGNSVFANQPSKVAVRCYKPLYYAKQNNLNKVRDYNDISVEECFDYMQNFVFRHLDSIPELVIENSTNMSNRKELFLEKQYTSLTKRDLNSSDLTSGKGITLEREYYDIIFTLFARAVQILSIEEDDIEDLCNPLLSKNAKIYQIVTNLVVGFFIPFFVIIVTNLYIAYHIWMPAHRRLKNRKVDLIKATSRPLPNDHPLQNHYSTIESERCNGSSFVPSTTQNLTKRNEKTEKMEDVELQHVNSSKAEFPNESSISKKLYLSPYSFARNETCEVYRERTPSFLRMLQKKFRTSTYSADSFPTDMTSLATSYSPGINQSKQIFLYSDETESQPLTGSSESSKRASIRSHSVIPEINIVTEEFENSLQEISTENKGSCFKKISTENTNLKAETTSLIEGIPNFEKSYEKALPASGSQANDSSTAPFISEDKSNLLLNSKMPNIKAKSSSRRLHSCRSELETHSPSPQLHEASSHSGTGGTRSHTTIYKNAERQIQLSQIILLYVTVFIASWLPSKIVTTIYFTDGYIGKTGHYCHHVLGITRILSFISVLLNPIVYAATQKTVNRYMHRRLRRLRMHLCLCSCVEKIASKFVRKQRRKDEANNEYFSSVKIDDTQNGDTRSQQHEKHRQRWSKIVESLDRKNLRFSYSVTHQNASKISDGTIDEEREGRRSNVQSSST